MRVILFIFLYFWVEISSGCNVPAIACAVVCVQDGDQKGVMIGSQCFCANARDMSKVPILVPKRGKALVSPTPRSWVE